MLKRLLYYLLGIVAHPVIAQRVPTVSQDTAYVHAVENALVHLRKGECQPCLANYKRAFSITQRSALSTLRAASCAYLCGQNEQALTYLNKAVSLDWWASEDMWENRKEYPEFDILRTSSLVADFVRAVDDRKIAEGRNPALERELRQIFQIDQQPRLKLDSIGRRYGFNSPQTKELFDEMRSADSLTLPRIENILQQYGYPGKHMVGEKQSITAWLVIQHAPLKIQEKYLPLMQKAADDGELPKANMALLIDRVRIRRGQKQLYGSQVHNGPDGKPQGFEPIEDERNVNVRRAEMGLPPLEEYAKHWGFEYRLPKQ